MHIYFSGIGGVGIGPLAHIALDAHYEVSGSDLNQSDTTRAIAQRGIEVAIGQDGSHITSVHSQKPIDWFVYTAALPDDHPELTFARKNGLRISKRDELLATILKDQNIKLVAVAGTHGKTTTTAMLAWVAKQIGLPCSYLVGSTLSFGPSGKLDTASPYFFYECDEFDRNFLHFYPHLSVITSIDYDHPDIFKTREDYIEAFNQFLSQSENSILWDEDHTALTGNNNANGSQKSLKVTGDCSILDEQQEPALSQITLPGLHNRKNGVLAVTAISRITNTHISDTAKWEILFKAINSFPGTGRRFEKLEDNLYSDYGHHPREISATLQLARELSDNVVLVYQPHQNTRQHQIKDEYKDALILAETIYWLPTYLTRENDSLPILEPAELIESLDNSNDAHIANLDEDLWKDITKAREDGKLVLCMGAGTIDDWVREMLSR